MSKATPLDNHVLTKLKNKRHVPDRTPRYFRACGTSQRLLGLPDTPRSFIRHDHELNSSCSAHYTSSVTEVGTKFALSASSQFRQRKWPCRCDQHDANSALRRVSRTPGWPDTRTPTHCPGFPSARLPARAPHKCVCQLYIVSCCSKITTRGPCTLWHIEASSDRLGLSTRHTLDKDHNISGFQQRKLFQVWAAL